MKTAGTQHLMFVFMGILISVLGMSGCSTIQQDMIVSTADEGKFQELLDIENELVLIRAEILSDSKATDIKDRLSSVRDRLDQLAIDPPLNNSYLAKLEALQGIEAYLAGNINSAKRFLASADTAWNYEEYALILESLLLTDPQERISFLDQQLKRDDTSYRLKAELGYAYYQTGQYGEAVAAFDEALPHLSQEYSTLFNPFREQAWSMKDGNLGSGTSIASVNADPIDAELMIQVTLEETSLLQPLLDGRNLNINQLFGELKDQLYLTPDLELRNPITRKDAALFLWHMVSDKESDPGMLTRYSSHFTGKQSPIPDVPTADMWFDSVLGCVETEIMALPDGRDFYPDRDVPGLDFVEWLTAAKEY